MNWFSLYVLGHAPWFWLGVMILCLLIESFTLALTTIWFACGALVMIFAAFLPLPFRWQLLLFLLVSAASMFFMRPVARRHISFKKPALNSDALVGKHVLVRERITALEKGAVKVNGVVWSATSADNTEIEAGTECVIKAIEGATVVVKKV
ncbi:MAG: NfeD family protein [Treponema sp.]|nr:NfeD family protein [Treponema sp.]